MRTYTSSEGTQWGVTVVLPGASNAMIVFRHPDGGTSGRDRYNWILTHGPESRSVTGRLDPKKVLDALSDADVAQLHRRSMAVSRTDRPSTPRADAHVSQPVGEGG